MRASLGRRAGSLVGHERGEIARLGIQTERQESGGRREGGERNVRREPVADLAPFWVVAGGRVGVREGDCELDAGEGVDGFVFGRGRGGDGVEEVDARLLFGLLRFDVVADLG